MADLKYGLVHGNEVGVPYLVDSSTATITVGDFVSLATAGYIKAAAAGDIPVGVAMESCTAPGADGGKTILVNVSADCVFRYPPDAGSVTQGLVGLTCDLGGARSLDIDASTDDVVEILAVDTDNNFALVRRVIGKGPGVV